MFDIGFWELALIVILALVVLGPKRLPEAARTAGRWLGRMRHFVANVKQDLDTELQGGGLEELRRLKQELDETRATLQDITQRAGDSLISGVSDVEHTAFGEPEPDALANDDELADIPTIEPPRNKTATDSSKKKKKKKAAKKSTRKKSTGKKAGSAKTSSDQKASKP